MRDEYSGEKRDLFELDVYELDAVEPNMVELEVVEIDLTAAEAHEPDVSEDDFDDFDEEDLVMSDLDEAELNTPGPNTPELDALELVDGGADVGAEDPGNEDRPDADELVGDERELARAQRNHPAARRPSWERRTRVAVTSLAVVAIMFLFVFPTRSYLAQRRQVSQARHAVAVLKAQNASLAREAKQLHTPTEIERLARVEFNMVFKGEQAYSVIPAPTATSPAGGSSSKSTTAP